VASQVEALERAIDRFNERLQPLKSFILPGGTPAAAHLHVARTVCRRAEIAVVAIPSTESINPQVLCYLNRLSDLLFVMARTCNDDGQGDVLWTPGKNRQ
jgi:cob(I)alamin adenosyltransferase